MNPEPLVNMIEHEQAEVMFRRFLEAAPDAMVIVNRDGRIVLANAQTEKLFGYSRDELIGEAVEILVPERFRAAHMGHRTEYFADHRTRPMGAGFDLYGRRKDGTEFPAEISLSPMETVAGVLAVSAIRDVTETRRQQELELLYALDRVMAQANQPEDVARIATEHALPLLRFDAAAAFLLDTSGQTLRLLHAHALPPEVLAASEQIPLGVGAAGHAVAWRRPVIFTIDSYPEMGIPRLADALRHARFLTIAATPFLAHGHVYGALSLASRQRLHASEHLVSLLTSVGTQVGLAVSYAAERERLASQERLAALGRLAAGIAHELNNPLARIVLETDLLPMNLAEGQLSTSESLSRYIAIVREAAGRMRRILQGLSTYAKPPMPEPMLLNISDLLAATGELVAHQARKSHITIAVDVPATLPLVLGDRSQLMQVLLNLTTNALEAMAETGGQVTLTACVEAEGGRGHGEAFLSALPEGTVRVDIADTGPGIPSQVLPKIWEPFYTTKPEGSGLGLAIVQSLVKEQPGASIDVTSRPGYGTTFTLTLPVAQPR